MVRMRSNGLKLEISIFTRILLENKGELMSDVLNRRIGAIFNGKREGFRNHGL